MSGKSMAIIYRVFVFLIIFFLISSSSPFILNSASDGSIPTPSIENKEVEIIDENELETTMENAFTGDDFVFPSSRSKVYPDKDVWIQKGLPSARSEHAAVFDNLNNAVFMYGGADQGIALSDLWRFDIASSSWKEQNDGPNPGGRIDHDMIFSSTTGKIYLFGGYDGKGNLNDLWKYNISSMKWSLVEINTGPVPEARKGHSIIYDNQKDAIYLFGGLSVAKYFNDVWKFDISSSTWTKLPDGSTKPSARVNSDMVYDKVNNNLYIYGGFDGTNYLDDLWKFNIGSSAWTPLTPSGSEKPPECAEHSLVFDDINSRIFLFGGIYLTISSVKEYRADFWYYDVSGNQWYQPEDGDAPSPRARHDMVLDSANNKIYVIQGYSGEFKEDLWCYTISQNRWEVIFDSSPVKSPSIRNGMGLIYNHVNNCLYYFGGYYNDGQPHYREDMWRYDLTGGTWTMENEGTGPAARFARGVVFDEHHNEIYMFGGYYYDFFAGTKNYLNDLWVYNITTHSWLEVNDGTTVPAPRDGHNMIYDPVNGDIYLHGGRKWISGTTYRYYGDLWKYDISGKTWTNLTDPSTVTARSRQEMCYDSLRGDIYIFGGMNETGYNNDTWKYNVAGGVWTKLATGGTPPGPRGAHDIVYDSFSDDIYLFSGKDKDSPSERILNDFYRYNVSTMNWTKLSLPAGKSPPPRIHYGFTYDRTNLRIYLTGGYYYDTSSTFFSDLWEYNPFTDSWTEKVVERPYPGASLDSELVSAGGARTELYMYGGWDNNKYLDTLWKYDISLDSFSAVNIVTGNRPSGRTEHNMVSTLDGKSLYLFGGLNGSLLSDLWKFDIDLGTWSELTPSGNVPPARKRSSMVYDGSDSIYLFGGWNGVRLGDFWKYDIGLNTWAELTPTGNKPVARDRAAITVDSSNGQIYLFGGYDSNLKYSNSLYSYNTGSDAWSMVSVLEGQSPAKREGSELYYEPDTHCLFVSGGRGESNQYYNDLHKFDIDNQLWFQMNTTDSKPAQRYAFGGAFDDNTGTIYQFGGSGSSLKGDLWSWNVAPPGITSIEIEFNDGDGNDNKTVYARYRPYDFVVKVSDSKSYKNLKSITFSLMPVENNYWATWELSSSQLIESSNINPAPIELTDLDSFENDGAMTWTVHFKLKFDWSYPDEALHGCAVFAQNQKSGSANLLSSSDLFHVENDLDFSGVLKLSGSEQGLLKEDDWVKKEETLNWQNLTVVYEGTDDIYPPDDEFDVTVWDDDGHVWYDTLSTGTSIDIASTADTTTDLTEDFTINISGIPAGSDKTSQMFSLKVDSDLPEFSNPQPTASIINNDLKVKCSVNITDGEAGRGSGVDASTIEYSYSTNDGGTWSSWASAGYSGIYQSVEPEVEVQFKSTFYNLIRWRASDAVNNDINISDNYRILVDSSYSPFAPSTVLLSPYSGSKVSGLQPTFAWKGTDPDGDPITYDLYVGRDENLVRSRDSSVLIKSGIEVPFFKIDDELFSGAMYYWTVIPSDNAYTGRCLSDVWNFTPKTGLQGVPTTVLLEPEHNSRQTTLTPKLEWDVNYTGSGSVSNLILIYIKNYESAIFTSSGLVAIAEFTSSFESGTFFTPELEDGIEYEWLVIPHSGDLVGTCENGPYGFSIDTSYKTIFNISLLAPSEFSVKQGGNLTTSITIKNTGNEPDIFRVNMNAGKLDNYISIGSYSTDIPLEVNEEIRLDLTIVVPDDFIPGDYPVSITVSSMGSSENVKVSKTIIFKITGETKGKVTPEEKEGGDSTLLAIIIVVIIIIIVLLLVVFMVISKKKKKALEAEEAGRTVPTAHGEVTAEVSYIPKTAFESERTAYNAVTGTVPQQTTTDLPGYTTASGEAGGAITPVETLPPQPEAQPEPSPMLQQIPTSPYEDAVTETPVEPPAPEGWTELPQLPSPEQSRESQPEDDFIRFDSMEGSPPPEPPQSISEEEYREQAILEQQRLEEEEYQKQIQQQYYQTQYPQQQPPQQAQAQYPGYIGCTNCGGQMPYGYTNCTYCGAVLNYM